jgi:hypothetical protein
MHVIYTPALTPSQSHVNKHTQYFSINEWLDYNKAMPKQVKPHPWNVMFATNLVNAPKDAMFVLC